jgi:hypothetical protein
LRTAHHHFDNAGNNAHQKYKVNTLYELHLHSLLQALNSPAEQQNWVLQFKHEMNEIAVHTKKQKNALTGKWSNNMGPEE